MMYSIMLTEGDILDRLSILNIKKGEGLEVDFLPFDRYISKFPNYKENPYYVRLRYANLALWAYEDEIRQAHNKGDLEAVANISKRIIEYNRMRAEIKKELDGDAWEKKSYLS